MTEIMNTPVTDATAWGGEIQDDPSWRVHLGAAEQAALTDGLKAVQAKGLSVPLMRAEDFPIGEALRPVLDRIGHDTKDGRGFVLLHGFPIEGFTVDEIRMMYWGISLHLGTCISQDGRGSLVADVMDRNQVKTPLTRAYGSKRESKLHVDLADVVGLLCVRQSAMGGMTTLASSMTVFNQFLAKHPEFLPMLFEGFQWDRFGEHGKGEAASSPQPIPIFSAAGGQLSCRYNRSWITGSFARANRTMTNAETAMFEFFDEVAERNRIEFTLQPGDVYFASNYTVLHGKTAQEEPSAEETAKRLLLRVWYNVPGFRRFAQENVRYGLSSHGNLGWTSEEMLTRTHLVPGAERKLYRVPEAA